MVEALSGLWPWYFVAWEKVVVCKGIPEYHLRRPNPPESAVHSSQSSGVMFTSATHLTRSNVVRRVLNPLIQTLDSLDVSRSTSCLSYPCHVRRCRRPRLSQLSEFCAFFCFPNSALFFISNQNTNAEYCSPLTSFDWCEADPATVGTSSIDTTCTIWDVAVRAALGVHGARLGPICSSYPCRESKGFALL